MTVMGEPGGAVVLEIDRSRMTFSCEGREKALTFADVMNLREKEL